MTEFSVETTVEEKLRGDLARLKFTAGHMALVLQLLKETYEAGGTDYEEVYLRANGMLEMYELRTSSGT